MRFREAIKFERVGVYYESGDYIVHNVDLNSWVVFSPDDYRIAARMIYEGELPANLLKSWPKSQVLSVFGKLLLYKIGYQGAKPEDYRAIEAMRDKSISDAPPGSVYFVTGDKCNLNCVYCYAESSPWRSTTDDLSTTEAIEMIDQISDLGVQTIVFTGGEALLRKDILELMEHAKSLGLQVNLITNGLLLNKHKVNRLRKICSLITISMDSLEKDEHEANRGKNTWLRVMNSIDLVLEAGISLRINQTIGKNNANAFDEMRKFAEARGITLNVVPITTIGRGDEETQGLNAFEHRELSDKMLDAELEGIQEAGCQDVMLKQFSHNVQCGHGSGEFSIDGRGNIFPCKLMHKPSFQAGSIRETPLKEIWQNAEVLKQARRRTAYSLPDCVVCNFREACGGGCRASHWGTTDDPDGTDYSQCANIRRTIRKRMWMSFRLKNQEKNSGTEVAMAM